MQLRLIHGSKTLQGRNIVRYYETYRTEDIPRVKNAWRVVISTEPIFWTRFRLLDDRLCLVEEGDPEFVWEEVTVGTREEYEYKKARRLLAGYAISPGPSFVHLVRRLAEFRNNWEPTGKEFWAAQEAQLHTASSALHLPTPGLPFHPVYAGRHLSLEVAQEDLFEHAKNAGITVASIFYAAWALGLTNYVDSNHVSFGIVLSGRSLPLPDVGSVVGPLVNVVAFQLSLKPSESVPDYLMSAFRHSIELDRFQWANLEHGINAQKITSLLTVHFETSLFNPNPLHPLRKPHISMVSDIPLSVDIDLDGKIQLFYQEHKFYADDMERLGRLFAKAVGALVNSDRTVEQCCNVLISEDMEKLRANGNLSSTVAASRLWPENLVDLFDQAAMGSPELVAIEKDSTAITYSELSALAEAVSRHLIRHINSGEVVCVHADRSVNWVLAIYGILRAGGVYCPLDKALPSDL
ncbi:hypothetical protein DL768_006768 [Monosporascus sp. mg162]|nr:hypothetical protein DL768_006768 [Monosporascus sp. mg162]